MTPEEVAERLRSLKGNSSYQGDLSQYAVNSIENALSNYPVANLINYCMYMDFLLIIEDKATLDRFEVKSLLELHQYIDVLMKRYKRSIDDIFHDTGSWYSSPATLDKAVYDRMVLEGRKHLASISIKTLLAVCEGLHLNLLIESN